MSKISDTMNSTINSTSKHNKINAAINIDEEKPQSLSFKYLANDIPAGLVVFLVALPLCLGISLASGAPLFSGIIAGIVGGLVVASASGSPLSVSGPAAGLTVIVINSIQQLGAYENFLLAVCLSGLLQIALGYLKAGIIGYYFPSGVIKGMLAAIGLILIFKQIPHALGYDKDSEGDFYFNEIEGNNTFSSLFNSINYLSIGAIIISAVSLAIIVLWDKPFMKKFAITKNIPGALIAVITGTLINQFFITSMQQYALNGDHLVQLPVAATPSEFITQFTLPNFAAFSNYNVYMVAVTIAIVASLESLLSVEATDKLDPYKRNTPNNRELKAQGLGNFISGLIGGLPLTAVIVRSSANVNAGAKTKLSAIVHGLLLLLCVIFIPGLLNKIPLASLAAVLLVVGYKLSTIKLYKNMYRLGWNQFLPFVITVIAILFTDLLKGISIGMVVAIFFILRNNYKRPYFYVKTTHKKNDIITIELAEEVTFINKGAILLTLHHIPENSKLIIDGSRSKNIDLDVLEIIDNFKQTAVLKNIELNLIGVPEFKGVKGH